jgi:hypothetical protein
LQKDRGAAQREDHSQKRFGQGYHVYYDTTGEQESEMTEAERISCFTVLMAEDDPDDKFLVT